MAENCSSNQIISGAGEFDALAMERLITSVNGHDYGLSYAVVAIIGPQSSGKSTLLNYLFGTHFRLMDASKGRSQTTTGIWMAKAVGEDPLTLVMDLEGSDSQIRADEEDTTFEKRSALFALAVADIVIINMWCNDIGRETAACRPLQKTVLEVYMRLSTSKKKLLCASKQKLLYVIRDKIPQTPFEILEHNIKEDIEKMWKGLPKPDAYKLTPLSQIFNVEVIALASYLYKEELFKKEVADLRQRFFNSMIPEVLAGDRRRVVSLPDLNQIWSKIKANEDLDLPAHRIMVATVRCEEIANEKLSQFKSDEEWKDLEQKVSDDPGAISEFGKRASSILERHFKKYDDECKFLDEDVSKAKREYLESKAIELLYPSYKKQVEHQRSISSRSFKNQLEERLGRGEGFAAAARRCHESSILEFNQRCSDGAIRQANWEDNAKKVREKLIRDIEDQKSDIRRQKLSELEDQSKEKLLEEIEVAAKKLFKHSGPQTWASIRELLGRKSDEAGSAFTSAVAGFELEQEKVAEKVLDLKDRATKLVEDISRKRAGKAMQLMKKRFNTAFDSSFQNHRTEKGNSPAVLKAARGECLELLSIMAVMGLDNEGRADNVKGVLFKALMSGNKDHRLDSDTWDDVPPEKTLITPIQCKALWEEFIVTTDHDIRVAELILKEEENNNRGGKGRSFWFILVMVTADGAEAFMKVTRDPTLLPKVIREFVNDHHEDIAELYKMASKFVKSQGLMEQLREWVDQFWRYLRSKYRQFFGTERAYGHRIYQPLSTN